MPAVSQSHPAPTVASLPTTEASRLGGGTDPDSASLVSPQGLTLFSSIHHPIPSHIPHPRHPASRQVGTIGSLCFHLPRYATVPIQTVCGSAPWTDWKATPTFSSVHVEAETSIARLPFATGRRIPCRVPSSRHQEACAGTHAPACEQILRGRGAELCAGTAAAPWVTSKLLPSRSLSLGSGSVRLSPTTPHSVTEVLRRHDHHRTTTQWRWLKLSIAFLLELVLTCDG
ncbi:hypothetical protein B0T11DRAFT_55905 [Plectosphaerella cucumerina]|jgi:hypothetical protein|uniref:Uncharacterized protein n=1 Tax=Plectosphaerella cucumerina TaxID=40658 RepID=A0A8K0TQU4_9PEZI|nr:hypothetical protein B0T11DRAFT_55905 [Plectosphaerella cucumerina]